jgi:hypothetical protein
MALSMGAAFKWQRTVRPLLARSIKSALASTSRCFMTAGRETGNGCASSVTDWPS